MVRDHIRETLPDRMRIQYGLLSLRDALYNIHFPQSPELLRQAQYRLKFEELLGIQLGIQSRRTARLSKNNGFLFPKVGGVFNTFFNTRLPFPLTGAQKRVIREIRQDTVTGHQMNRLLQGDVAAAKRWWPLRPSGPASGPGIRPHCWPPPRSWPASTPKT